MGQEIRTNLLEKTNELLSVQCFTLDNLWQDYAGNKLFQLIPPQNICRVKLIVPHVTEFCPLKMWLFEGSPTDYLTIYRDKNTGQPYSSTCDLIKLGR